MYNCQYCGKECKNMNSLRNHQRMCPSNPDDSYRRKFNNKGKPGWNRGLTKETSSSVAKYAKSLTKKKPDWQIEVDDDGKLYQRFANKRVNAKAKGLQCDLTFEQYCSLVKEAGLVSSQLGFTGDMYVLARYNDEGNYTYGNCRFIKQVDNAKERKVSDKMLRASSTSMCKINERMKTDSVFREYVKSRRECSEYFQQRHRKSEEKEANKDRRYCKEHNSQYGTYWITDGTINQKWSDKKWELPQGFRRGRVTK